MAKNGRQNACSTAEPLPGSDSEDAAIRDLVAQDEAGKATDTPVIGAAPDGGKPSSLETFKALGRDSNSMTEKSEAEIAAALQASMAARLPDVATAPEDDVRVTVPNSFFLRLDNHQLIAIKAGTPKLPRSQAEHTYAKANGVKLLEQTAEDAYDQAAADIVAGKFDVEYAVPQMASHFKVDQETVRAELTARVEKLTGAAQ